MRHDDLCCRDGWDDCRSGSWNDGQVHNIRHQADESSDKARVDAGERETRNMVQRSVGGKKSWMVGYAVHEHGCSWSIDGQAGEVRLKGTSDPNIANADGQRAL